MDTLTKTGSHGIFTTVIKDKGINIFTAVNKNYFQSIVSFTKETTSLESLGDKRSFMVNLFEAQGIDLTSVTENKPRIEGSLVLGRVFILPKKEGLFSPIGFNVIDGLVVGENNEPSDNILSIEFKTKKIYEDSLTASKPSGYRYMVIEFENFNLNTHSNVKTIDGKTFEIESKGFQCLTTVLDLSLFVDLVTGNMQVITKTMPGYSLTDNQSIELSDEQKETFRELDFEVVGFEISGIMA